jgi:LPS-assembly protein
VPVMYMPYFSHPDPSQRRASGFLVPSLGTTKYLGGYIEIPYFWAIDDSTDATIAPLLTTRGGQALDLQFRHQFNDGTVTVNGSVAYAEESFQADLFAKGQFAIDDEWRWGFDLERATSAIYMRDYRIDSEAEVLTSQIYLEGFGQGSFSRLDVRAYQGLTSTGTSSNVITAELPYILPRYQYSFVGEPDALGGRVSVDAGALNLIREEGVNTERANLSVNWERPVNGALGDLWKLVLHVDSAGYAARQLDQQPSWGPVNQAETAQAMPTAAVELHWPFERDAGSWGTQVVEPIAQLIAAPNGSTYGLATKNGVTYVNSLVPNEDSLDFEFTDATLFSLNRFYGIDRLEGGMRANVGLHGAWYFPNGQQIDGQIGQGYRAQPEPAFPVGSGLNGTATDVVSHLSYLPSPWFDVTTRERFDHQNFALRFADALVTTGPSWLRLNAGYLYTSDSPYTYYDTVPSGVLTGPPRNEVNVGATAKYGNWRLHGSLRRDLETNQMVSAGVGGGYEDECFVFDVELYRRYTSLDGDNGDTSLLFQLTFKTVGTFGFSSL